MARKKFKTPEEIIHEVIESNGLGLFLTTKEQKELEADIKYVQEETIKRALKEQLETIEFEPELYSQVINFALSQFGEVENWEQFKDKFLELERLSYTFM